MIRLLALALTLALLGAASLFTLRAASADDPTTYPVLGSITSGQAHPGLTITMGRQNVTVSEVAARAWTSTDSPT